MANKNLKRKFFKEDTEHGRVKRIMYKKYIQAYLAKTQNEKFTLRSIIIDGFAGCGRYGNDWPNEIDKYGSPLISLMVSLGLCYKKDMEEKKKIASQKKTEEAARREEKADDMDKTVTEEIEADKPEENADDMDKTVSEEIEPDTPALKNDTKKCNLWGWPSSEFTPEEELAREAKIDERRKPYFDVASCDVATKISLIFIESDDEIFKELIQNVELLIIKFLRDNYPSHYYKYSSAEREVKILLDTAPFSISVKIINKEFEETNPPSALYDKDVRSLTFLDPFGFTQTPMCHVKKFAPGPGNEVFINFMSGAVNRFVSRSTEGVVDLYGMSDQFEDVARSLGINPPDLEDTDGLADFVKCVIHSAQPDNKIHRNKINSCTAIYESFLKEKTNCKYSLVFEVKDKRNLTIYHMIHVTNHIRGIGAMKESMNRCSQREGEMVMSAYDIVRKGHVLNLCNLDDPVKVAEKIYEQFRCKKAVRLEEIEECVLVDTKYLFRKTPLKILKDEGLIAEVLKNGKRKKSTNKFPQTDKVTKKPIFWRFSFSDENFNVKHEMKSNKNTEETKRKREEAKGEKERKKEERRKLIEEKKKKREEAKGEKERKKEERRRLIEEKKRKREEAKGEKERKKEARRKLIEEKKRKREEAKEEKERKKELQRESMGSQMLITEVFSGVNKEKAEGTPANHDIGCFGDAGCDEENTAPLIGESKGEKAGKKAQKEKGKGKTKKKMQQVAISSFFMQSKRPIEDPLKDKCSKNITDVVLDVMQRRKRKSRSASLENGVSKKTRSEQYTRESQPETQEIEKGQDNTGKMVQQIK